MNYKNIMEDCVLYMKRHPGEDLSAEMLGKLYSYKGEYFSFLFSCYYRENLDVFLGHLKECVKRGGIIGNLAIEKRHSDFLKVEEETMRIEGFWIKGSPVLKKQMDLYQPMEALIRCFKERDSVSIRLGIWWYDEEFQTFFMAGEPCKREHLLEEEQTAIYIPAGNYRIFEYRYSDSDNLTETAKNLFHFVQTKWMADHAGKADPQGYSFFCIKENKICYCQALLEEEKEEAIDKVYGVDTWIQYINENITGNLTISSLAKKFHYSGSHFKRIFRYYYKMSVADYIRKRRLIMIAESIRDGVDYAEASSRYGFKTYAGFARAFKKEFNMSPATYSKGMFEVIDLARYYRAYKDSLRLTIVNLKPIHMIGHSVIHARGEEVDIPAQVNYWLGKDFPCLENTRFSCNIERREDKIALWYKEENITDIEYILGPVVEEFTDDIPEDMIRVTLEGGKYAIFETEKMSDKEDIVETIRMYARCVYYGWIKEYRDRVDLSRITFERYVNDKIYFYVPVKY